MNLLYLIEINLDMSMLSDIKENSESMVCPTISIIMNKKSIFLYFPNVSNKILDDSFYDTCIKIRNSDISILTSGYYYS